jgi:hypothetical protein
LRLPQSLSLQRLTGRVIDFEQREVRKSFGNAERRGIQSSAEDDTLSYSSVQSRCERIFAETAARNDVRAKQCPESAFVAGKVRPQFLLGGRTELEQLRGAAKTTGGAARSLAQQLHSTLTALEEAGEPVLTPRLNADVLRHQLTAFGFSQLDSFDTADLGATYFQGRSDGLELRIPVSIMRARV